MGRPKRSVRAAANETTTPPHVLTPTQSVARVSRATGNHLYECTLPNGEEILAELPPRFRNTIWIKRGGYVLVDAKDADARSNKIYGDILNVIREEREWRKQEYWPKEFVKTSAYRQDSEEESITGKMPSSDDSGPE